METVKKTHRKTERPSKHKHIKTHMNRTQKYEEIDNRHA